MSQNGTQMSMFVNPNFSTGDRIEIPGSYAGIHPTGEGTITAVDYSNQEYYIIFDSCSVLGSISMSIGVVDGIATLVPTQLPKGGQYIAANNNNSPASPYSSAYNLKQLHEIYDSEGGLTGVEMTYKCECGSDAVGSPRHSDFCPKYSRE